MYMYVCMYMYMYICLCVYAYIWDTKEKYNETPSLKCYIHKRILTYSNSAKKILILSS